MSIHPSVYKHPSAIIDFGASIGENSKIWHWTHICKGAKIGNNCSFGQNVYVGNQVVISDNVKIQNNVSIFDNIVLEKNVFCGPSVVFTNVYNPRSLISRKSEYLKTTVKEGATLGANSTIVCGIIIGEFSFIGAGALVNKNIKPFALMVGVPCKQIGWMSIFGKNIDLPLKGEGEWVCPDLGHKYRLKESDLFLINN